MDRTIADIITHLVLPDAAIKGLEASFPIQPWQVYELAALKETGRFTGAEIRIIYKKIKDTDTSPVIAAIDYLEGKASSSDLKPICQKAIDDNPKQTEQYRKGQTKLINFFVGQVMKSVPKGTASASDVKSILEELL